MKKSRTKFLSVFAILFVAIFAVSCCFFAACKGGSDDGGNSGDTGTQQGDDTGSGSGDDSGSGSGTDGSGSGTGTEDGSESGPSQTVTKVVYLATSSDVEYTTAGEAVFENGSDLEITTSDGLTYTVSGTASVMGEAEAAWYATDDVEEGTPYVVIKIAVAEGESIYFENSQKTYTNDEDGAANFDKGYIFIVCKLSFEGDKCVTETKYDITSVEGEAVTYTVSFSGVTYPVEDVPVEYTQSHTIDFNVESTYAFIETAEGTDENNVQGQYATVGTHTSGILSLVIDDANKTGLRTATLNGESVGVLVTGGRSTSNKLYFQVNPAAYAGENLKIEVTMSGSEETGSSLFVASKAMDVKEATTSTSGILDGVTSTGIEDVQTLTYETVASSSSLYLLVSANTTIFSITISLTGDVDPWANEGTTNPNDDPQKSTEAIASFFVPDATDAGSATTGSFSASTAIDDNEIFTLTAGVDMTYAYGTDFGNLQNISDGTAGPNAVSYSKLNGDTVNPYQGLESTAIAKTSTDENTEEVTYTHVDNIISVTAKADITIYVYVTLADNGYTGNRTGYVYGCIGTTVAFSETASARKTVIMVTADLQNGETLTIGALNTHSSDARLWFFGAEATAL